MEFAAGAPTLLMGGGLERVATEADQDMYRHPLGAVGITPFNFPCMIPLWMAPSSPPSGCPAWTRPRLTPGTARVDWVADFTERYPEAYARELEAFARAILEDGPVGVTGEDALAAFVLARAAERSSGEGRTVKLRHEVREGAVLYEAEG